MRLIDTNKLNCLLGISEKDIYVKYLLDRMETIDPEMLPIVRQLREELAKVTAERDAAVGLLKRVNDETGNCYGCKYFDIERGACTDREKKVSCDCRENNMWEWRGQQKEE